MKRKRSWKNRNAVSEIIGNLLILAITVILFSGILYFVSSMPTPTPATYGDFIGEVQYNDTVPYCNITIKHMGGQVLEDRNIDIYLLTKDDHFSAKIADSDPSIGDKWNLGATWTYNDTTTDGLCNINDSSYLKVMIIDTEKNAIIWEGVLLDNSANSSKPVIMDRYLASHVDGDIWVRDTSFTNSQYVALFANVFDAGNDLAMVSADVSSLGGPLQLDLADNNGDGWWSSYFRIDDTGTGPRTIYIVTIDKEGRSATATLTVNVYAGGDDPSSPGGAGSGSPPGNLYFSGLQGLNVFKYDEWNRYNYSAIPTTHLDNDELGVVVVASKFLVNLENANEFYIIDPKTRAIYDTVSSPNVIFHSYDFYSGYYLYSAVINTNKLDHDKQYLIQIQLRDTWMPNNNVFFATVNISVGNAELPKFETFSDPNYINESNNFTSDQTIYVKITTATDGAPLTNAGLVEICDYAWNMQVKRIPGQEPIATNPVTAIVHEDGTTVYKFSIKLSLAHQDPWIPGKSAYALRYDMFETTEEKQLLIKMLNITAPKIIMDMATGIDAVKGGWAEGSLINYYKNDNQWVPPDFITPWPGKHATEYSSAAFVRLGDINSNGKSDVVAVLSEKGVAKYIYVYLNNGQWSPRPVEELGRGTITAIELANVDSDNSVDIIIGYADGSVGYYRNDGMWTYTHIDPANPTDVRSKVTAIVACDTMNTQSIQGYPSGMDVLVGYQTGGVRICKNLGGLGTSWDCTATFTGGIPTYESYRASSENPISSDAIGTYIDTWYDDESYEQLSQVGLEQQVWAFPNNPIGETYMNYPGGTTTYSLAKGGVINSNGWNTWRSMQPEEPFTSVVFKVEYRTENGFNYDPANPPTIKWGYASETTLTKAAVTLTASSTFTTLSFELPADVATYSELSGLQFSLTNTGSKSITFNYWVIEVAYTSNNMGMEHEWTFDGLPEGIQTVFDIYAGTGGIDGDTFQFQYRWGTSASFQSFSTPLIVDSTTGTYRGIIGVTPTGENSLVIRVSDLDKISTMNVPLVVDMMSVTVMSVSTDPIGSVTSIRVGDMDGLNGPDMVISDQSNVWVCLNDGEGSLLSDTTKVTASKPLTNILTIGIGKFHGRTGLMDIAAGTSTGVYLINQTSPGIYASGMRVFTASINAFTGGDVCMVVGDLEGDGDMDIVIASGTYLQLYTNDVQDGVSTFRPVVTIDIAAAEIKTLFLGKLQNN